MGPFWGLFFWFRFRSFLTFFKVFALGCVISLFFLLCFSCPFFGPGCWAPCCFFFGRAFCVFLCFLFFLCFFSVPFWPWVLGAVLLFFRSGFLGVFLFVFSLLFVLFLATLENKKKSAAKTHAEICRFPFCGNAFFEPSKGVGPQ